MRYMQCNWSVDSRPFCKNFARWVFNNVHNSCWSQCTNGIDTRMCTDDTFEKNISHNHVYDFYRFHDFMSKFFLHRPFKMVWNYLCDFKYMSHSIYINVCNIEYKKIYTKKRSLELTPDFFCYFFNQFNFSPLFIFCHDISFFSWRKTALWA